MARTLTEKIIAAHLISGRMIPGEEIALRIDQTLTQDATGTQAYLAFETLGIDRVKTDLSVSYVDHNTLQAGPQNPDDHRFLRTAAARYGVYYSRPGNGICHQVHLERFAIPGGTLLGSDSHTPTCGGLGMLAIGAGGLDVAAAMAGEPFYLAMPQIVRVRLNGRLPAWVTAKDVILELLRRYGVKWGKGKVLEYGGPGLRALSVPERATIANMGTELGLTSSLFPSDARTREFLAAQQRAGAWRPLKADRNANYTDGIEIDCGLLKPLIALPHSPGSVKPVREVEGIPVDQVCIGSCTNSSLRDMLETAAILKGRTVPPGVSLTISPGSRQVLRMITSAGALEAMLAAGARFLENACGPCIGMGSAPPSGGVSLRTFNRNFKGRSGTPDAQVFLCSPVVAAVSALAGAIRDPWRYGKVPRIRLPRGFLVDDSMIVPPPRRRAGVKVVKGPNIKPMPRFPRLSGKLEATVLLRCGDNVSTDDIMPAGAKVLPYRSNIPALSDYAFERLDSSFADRARKAGGGVIVAGVNYGQGSSREHAAIVPRFLGIRAVIAVSFARIHQANLVNFGIVPLVLEHGRDLQNFSQGDLLRISGLRRSVPKGMEVVIENVTKCKEVRACAELSARSRRILCAGGLLNDIRNRR